nr:hypothetical protein [Brachybacterium sp. Z12]
MQPSEHDGAGLFEALDHRRGGSAAYAPAQRHPDLEGLSLDAIDVLDRDRHSVERASPSPRGQFRVQTSGTAAAPLAIHMGEGAQLTIEHLDPTQLVLQQFGDRYPPRADEAGDLAD